MRIHRIGVTDFRGIAQQELTFAEQGVTVVEAPNEAGKSSLLEAVRLLLGYKDRSRAAAVTDVQPVGRDVGTLVEAELSIGEHRLTCRKQFNRGHRTELWVHAPVVEQLSGDAAHDRLQALLDASLDRALFEALWFRQGEQLRRIELDGSSSVSAALDETAEGSATDAGEDGLLHAAEEERTRYWTAKAERPAQRLKAHDRAVTEAGQRVEGLAGRLQELERDIERSQATERDLAAARADRAVLAPEVEAHEDRLAELGQLQDRVEAASAALQRARADHTAAVEAVAEREGRATAVADAEQQLTSLKRQEADLAERLEVVVERVEALRVAHDRANQAAREAEATTARCREDVGLLSDEQQLAELERRHSGVATADEHAAQAEQLLAVCRLTSELLGEIDAAEQQVALAQAQLDAGAPDLSVEAHQEFLLEIDGERRTLAVGEQVELAVITERVLDVGELARVRVRPGSSLEELTETLRAARERRSQRCAEAGVADRQEAFALDRRRREAERTVAERDQRVAELLGEDTREQLAERVRTLTRTVAGRRAERSADPPLPEDLPHARARLGEAETAAGQAARDRDDAHAAWQAAEPDSRELREQLAHFGGQRAAQAAQLESDHQALAHARERHSDDDLAAKHAQAVTASEHAQKQVSELEQQLAAAQPEEVELLATNADKRLTDLDGRIAELVTEQTQVRERLRFRGEEGLGEELARARAEHERAEAARDADYRRAEAARLLHHVLADERERARAAYRAPLQEAIEDLGRIVFGRSFGVELDENLGVARRTLDGATVSWEHLSSGAQEQLSIVIALACARLVGAGGAPLILDDALGYTDPQRLERMGAVLGLAADDAQVIVLTCVAERYQHIGGAHTRRLQPTPAGAADG